LKKRTKLFCFNPILGYSRMIYFEFTLKIDTPLSHQAGRVCVLWRIIGDTLRKHETGYNQKSCKNPDLEYTKQFNDFYVQALRSLFIAYVSLRGLRQMARLKIQKRVSRGRRSLPWKKVHLLSKT